MAEALNEVPNIMFEDCESVTMPQIASSPLVPQIVGRIGQVFKITTQTDPKRLFQQIDDIPVQLVVTGTSAFCSFNQDVSVSSVGSVVWRMASALLQGRLQKRLGAHVRTPRRRASL